MRKTVVVNTTNSSQRENINNTANSLQRENTNNSGITQNVGTVNTRIEKGPNLAGENSGNIGQ